MKTYGIHLILAALAVTGLNAQDAKPPGDRRPPPPAPLLLPVLDADEDGALSAAEILASSTVLADLDMNGDGELTKKEIAPKPPKGTLGETALYEFTQTVPARSFAETRCAR